MNNLAAIGTPNTGTISPVMRQQAEELEGVFLTMLTKQMFATVKGEESLGGGGFGEETWRGMQAEELAKAIAQTGGIGLADQLMSEMLAQQEAVLPSANMTTAIGAYTK